MKWFQGMVWEGPVTVKDARTGLPVAVSQITAWALDPDGQKLPITLVERDGVLWGPIVLNKVGWWRFIAAPMFPYRGLGVSDRIYVHPVPGG